MSRNQKANTDVSICKHFLAAECDSLISMAKPRMERSGVSDSLTGKVKNRATTMVLHCSRAQDGGVDDVILRTPCVWPKQTDKPMLISGLDHA
jgi:hypothetical protein